MNPSEKYQLSSVLVATDLIENWFVIVNIMIEKVYSTIDFNPLNRLWIKSEHSFLRILRIGRGKEIFFNLFLVDISEYSADFTICHLWWLFLILKHPLFKWLSSGGWWWILLYPVLSENKMLRDINVATTMLPNLKALHVYVFKCFDDNNMEDLQIF